MNITHAARALVLGAVAVAATVALTACGDPSTPNHVESKSSATGTAAKADHIAPSWLPDEAHEIEVTRRTTGNERILVASYDGRLDSRSCFPIARPGDPSIDELTRAYSSDPMTHGVQPRLLTSRPSLTAAWWPTGQETKATLLCDRWWVGVDGGRIYAFSPELTSIAADPRAN
ncbi:hypothetical protein [Gordonia humi]|uniref:Lipoprotein n=1 Tax=Gordonia humi TaxID=686429 RepID=A0A840ERC2_9ACTN|nr:hypothetical protein [Gordonia humi]MBB4134081.1 hypothetical protein [Gordonia humi]